MSVKTFASLELDVFFVRITTIRGLSNKKYWLRKNKLSMDFSIYQETTIFAAVFR